MIAIGQTIALTRLVEVAVDTDQMIAMVASAAAVVAAVEYTRHAAFRHVIQPDRHGIQWTIALAAVVEIWAVDTIQKIGIPMRDPIVIQQIRIEDIIRQQ